MKLVEFYNHAEALADKRSNLWQIICMDAQGLDYVSDEELEVLQAMRVDTWDAELRKDLDEIIRWAEALNERVGA